MFLDPVPITLSHYLLKMLGKLMNLGEAGCGHQCEVHDDGGGGRMSALCDVHQGFPNKWWEGVE
jgi:hypothetical protein